MQLRRDDNYGGFQTLVDFCRLEESFMHNGLLN